MLLQKLRSQSIIHPPRWLVDNTAYLTQVGSVAYGVSGHSSDVDVYGYCIPPKDVLFPHTAGIIKGFGDQGTQFDDWTEHHIDPKDGRDTTYDFSIFSIVRFFKLCMECNPNMIDALFVPRRCIMHSTPLSEYVRDNRKLFLHKGAWHRFKGYAYSQMHKIKGKVNASNPARAAAIAQHGYDVKFAYHVVRLLNEVEQIMVEGDLDLERNNEQLKAIRRGEWRLEELEGYFSTKEKSLEQTYAVSKLSYGPDEEKIKEVLVNALEMHFGSLEKVLTVPKDYESLFNDLETLLNKHRRN